MSINTDDEFRRNAVALGLELAARIKRDPPALCPVFTTGPDDRELLGWTYTVGGVELWGCEFVLVNVVSPDNATMWWEFVRPSIEALLKDPGVIVDLSDAWREQTPDAPSAAAFLAPVPDDWATRNVTQQLLLGRDDPETVWQIVLPDRDGLPYGHDFYDGHQLLISQL